MYKEIRVINAVRDQRKRDTKADSARGGEREQ